MFLCLHSFILSVNVARYKVEVNRLISFWMNTEREKSKNNSRKLRNSELRLACLLATSGTRCHLYGKFLMITISLVYNVHVLHVCVYANTVLYVTCMH